MTIKNRVAALTKRIAKIAPPAVPGESITDRIDRFTNELVAHAEHGTPLSPELADGMTKMAAAWGIGLATAIDRVVRREAGESVDAEYPRQTP